MAMLQPWIGPYGGVPPWHLVRPEEFVSAFDAAEKLTLAEKRLVEERYEEFVHRGAKLNPSDKARYDLDFNEVKPYLQLEKLVEAMMWAAGQLYGLQFQPISDVPVFHPDVRVFEVVDTKGRHVGLWYLDPYARDGKRSGAWMTAYRTQENMDKPITRAALFGCVTGNSGATRVQKFVT